MNEKRSSVLCHLGETYSKAYEFFYEDIAPHMTPVRAKLMALMSQNRSPSRRDSNHAATALDFELCEQRAPVCHLK